MAKRLEKELFEGFSSFDAFDDRAFQLVKSNCSEAKTVLELGCGSGAWTSHLIHEAKRVIAVDFSRSLIQKTHASLKNDGCYVIMADAELLPIRSNVIDECFFGFSLHHMANISACLNEVYRCLRLEASIILVEPNGTNIIRLCGHLIGRLLDKTRLYQISSRIEKPININKVARNFLAHGFNCYMNQLQTQEKRLMKSPSFNVVDKIYGAILRLTRLVLPSIFGSSEFILIAIRH